MWRRNSPLDIKRLEAYGDDAEAVQAFGLEVVFDLCERLLAGGAPGLHFYTLNQAHSSLALLKMLNISFRQLVTPQPSLTPA